MLREESLPFHCQQQVQQQQAGLVWQNMLRGIMPGSMTTL